MVVTGEQYQMEQYKASIIGGGPIGGYIACKLGQKIDNISLFDQKNQIGKPLQCAGLISPRVLEMVPFTTKDYIFTHIVGSHIHTSSNTTFTVGGDTTHAYSINRKLLDQRLIEQAEKQGVNIYFQEKIISAQRQSNFIELETSQNRCIKTPLVIGADGPYSKMRDVFNFTNPKEFLRGIGAEITHASLHPHFVELFVGNSIAPGFFAWMIPTSDDGTQANIGLCTTIEAPHPPIHYFQKLFTNTLTLPYIKNATVEKKYGGIIPLGPLHTTVDDNIMLVGDAAAQVKPTSGGGIYPGLLCAKHCADVAIEAIQTNNYSSSFLQRYQDQWTKEIGRELKLGMKFRKIYKNVSDKQIETYIQKFKEKNIEEIITRLGDIDYPSKLIKPLIKKTPSLLKFLPQVLKNSN